MAATSAAKSLANLPRRHSPAADQSVDYIPIILDDILLAVFCMLPIILAAERSLRAIQKREESLKNKGKVAKEAQESIFPSVQLEANLFLVIPIAFSAALVLMYFFFAQLEFFIAVYIAGFSIFACAFTLSPLCATVFQLLCSARDASIILPCVGPASYSALCATALSTATVLAWLLTAHWILLDTLGVALVVCMLCHIRLPSLRVAAFIFLGLVVYDVFWVFFSEYFFQKNVMVEVALKEARNPVGIVAAKIGFPEVAKSSPPISLPGKLVFHGIFSAGVSFLGLGDVFVPGVVVCYAKRFDYTGRHDKLSGNGRRCLSYYICSLLGFFVGIMMSSVASLVYRVAQPALIYIVPTSLLPLLALSVHYGEARAMWNGERSSVKKATPLYPV